MLFDMPGLEQFCKSTGYMVEDLRSRPEVLTVLLVLIGGRCSEVCGSKVLTATGKLQPELLLGPKAVARLCPELSASSSNRL